MEEQGPVVNLRVFWSDCIFTTSPEHLKLILATEFDNYVKGQTYLFIGVICKTNLSNLGAGLQQRMEDLLGIGVFTSDGEMNDVDFISKNDASHCR